jgi:hypothetical protein
LCIFTPSSKTEQIDFIWHKILVYIPFSSNFGSFGRGIVNVFQKQGQQRIEQKPCVVFNVTALRFVFYNRVFVVVAIYKKP